MVYSRELLLFWGVVGCGGGSKDMPQGDAGATSPDAILADGSTGPMDAAPTPDGPPIGADLGRDTLSTALTINLQEKTATAEISVAPSTTSTAASFATGGLLISSVHGSDGSELPWKIDEGRLDVAVPASVEPNLIVVDYSFGVHTHFDGWLPGGMTFVWPYFCKNLYPCDPDPADGLSFTLSLTGVPEGKTAVFPAVVPADAPPYQIAWAVDDYQILSLGTTSAGTAVKVWYRPGQIEAATAGSAHLRDVFAWYETRLGAYLYGSEVGSVSVGWGAGAYGGMEHHPFWHVASGSLDEEEVHAHEAAHGWFGDGVRIACWEDFVLSEGTVSYLAARSLEATAGKTTSEAIWASYEERLSAAMSSAAHKTAWPQGGATCGEIDMLEWFSDIPYMKGAAFFRALEARVGREALDGVLAAFYLARKGTAARMSDLLELVTLMTGYDPGPCAAAWLAEDALPETPEVCPAS